MRKRQVFSPFPGKCDVSSTTCEHSKDLKIDLQGEQEEHSMGEQNSRRLSKSRNVIENIPEDPTDTLSGKSTKYGQGTFISQAPKVTVKKKSKNRLKFNYTKSGINLIYLLPNNRC